MRFSLDKIRNMPYPAKMGVTVWTVSWIWYLLTTYRLTNDTDNLPKMAIAIALLLVFVSQAQNWARIIAIMASLMGILFSSLFFVKGIYMIATVDVILLGGGIYYLMAPTTANHFKSQSKPAANPDQK